MTTSGGKCLTRRHALLGTGAVLASVAASCGMDNELAPLGQGIDQVTLIDATGATVRWADLRGVPRALFFGFTNCPVICPVTIYELTAASERIGARAQTLRIDFVTVDPERDTPERMRAYFSGFGPQVRGFTGAPEMLQRVIRAFEVTADRVALENGSYTMDHTATVFLLDRDGRVADVLAYGSEPTVIEGRIVDLFESQPT
jgi:protein SCO1/2